MIENYNNQVLKLIRLGDLIIFNSQGILNITKFARVSLGGTPSRTKEEYWGGSIKWINSGALSGQPAILNESECITELGVKYSATKSARRGDTVLSIIEPAKEKVSLILDDNVYFNQSVICISPYNKFDSGFIFFASRKLIDEIKRYATGSAQQSINKEIIEQSNIFIPNGGGIKRLNYIGARIVDLERKIRVLKVQKQLLLNKYF